MTLIKDLGRINLPPWTGIRVMMMPFDMQDVRTLPNSLGLWRGVVRVMCELADQEGVGYLTIDEADVKAGTTHRRPGMHVDGVGPDGKVGGWGGGGGYGKNGMMMVSSHVGCRAWDVDITGWAGPKSDGDCSHVSQYLRDKDSLIMKPNRAYWCGPMMVHEAIPMKENTKRSFVRVSYPSNAPWYEGYTVNPLGVQPTGPIHPARDKYMAYRP